MVAGWVTVAEEIANDVTGVAEQHVVEGYSDDVMSLEDEVERANQIAEQATSVRGLSQSLNDEAENLIGQLQQISDDVDITSSSIATVEGELRKVQRSLEDSETKLSLLIDDVSSIDDVIDRAESETESSSRVISESNLSELCDAIDGLIAWIGTETGSGDLEPEGPLTPESEDGMGAEVSGSGMGLDRDSLCDEVIRLGEGVRSVGGVVRVCEGVVNSAMNHTSYLQQQAVTICRYTHTHTTHTLITHSHTLTNTHTAS